MIVASVTGNRMRLALTFASRRSNGLGLDNAAAHLEDPGLRLLQIVRNAVRLGVATGEQQDHDDDHDGAEHRLPRLPDAALITVGYSSRPASAANMYFRNSFSAGSNT
jgi:hypothetical protein